MKWEKLATPIIVGIVLFALFKLFLATKHRVMEAFGYSEGTMVQLSSSHVPTMEDEEELLAERRQIDHDLIDMTGSA
jgi:hypothetical protein